MKVLSIAIPCYNSESYMKKCINSLLIGGDQVEIIIVDDGSTDGTAAIADRYEEKYPDIVKVIHQENGGHGEAVNAGIRNASGLYFKVVDSDDYLAKGPYLKVLDALKILAASEEPVDLVISNFIYDKQGAHRKKVMRYTHSFPHEEVFGWDRISRLPRGKYLLMHSLIYRTQLLHDCGLELPKHTFYVDNIYVYHPLPYMKKLYYIDVDLYHYFIGRDDQSVNEKNMLNRIDQQLLVTKILIKDHPLRTIENKKLRRYLSQYLAVMMAVSTSFLLKDGSPEALAKRDELWQFLKDQKQGQYKYVNRHILGLSMQMRSKFGIFIIKIGYKISQKLIGFN